MKSFGIYYKNAGSQTEQVGLSEVQMNIWKLTINKRKTYYLDFGLQFNSEIKDILVFVPFKIGKQQVQDLGSIISKDSDLISRLFNANTTSNHTTQSPFTPVLKDGSNRFDICTLDIENKTTIEDLKSGEKEIYSIIKFSISQKNEKEKPVLEKQGSATLAEIPSSNYYLRFRIKVEDKNLISKTEYVSNDIIQSAFSKLELFNIRLNDARHIPSNLTSIITNDRGYTAFYFSKVHYFYMVDIKESIQTTSPVCHDSRFMELADWKSYLGEEKISERNFISYHWKKEKENNPSDENIKSYQLCYSCVFPERNWCQLLAYAGLAILLGFIGSMLSFSFSSLHLQIPSWMLWLKVIVVIIIFISEVIYFWKFNNKG